MPVDYVMAMDGEIVLELWTGTVTLEELMAHKRGQFSNPSIKSGASVLSDCRRAEFEISPDDVSKLSEMENDPRGKSTIARYAFLVDNDTYERAQMFAEQVNRQGKSVIIFNSLDVAAVWLGMDSMKVRDLLKGMGG